MQCCLSEGKAKCGVTWLRAFQHHRAAMLLGDAICQGEAEAYTSQLAFADKRLEQRDPDFL